MPICYVLGGLGESVIARAGGLRDTLWIDVGVLMLGSLGQLRLAPDGTSPGEPDGVECRATIPVSPYCGLPALIVGAQLLRAGYTTRLHGWDWRKSVYAAGVDLAARIRREVAGGDPCAVVAHSAGGLVARAAWTELGISGDQGLVRRIVTLGTPHWGSYAAVKYWQGDSSSVDWLVYANQQLGGNVYGYTPDLFGYHRREPVYFQQLAQTWPAWYDVLPVLGAPDAADDARRSLLYDATNWPEEYRPQQAWLDHSRNVTGPWLRSAASQPPAQVLTCVSSGRSPVASALVDPVAFRRGGGLGAEVPGDNAVTQAAAELSGAVIWRYNIDHENLLPTLANSGDVANLVLEVRAPGPTPAPEQSGDQQTTHLDPLPYAISPTRGNPSQQCVSGNCFC